MNNLLRVFAFIIFTFLFIPSPGISQSDNDSVLKAANALELMISQSGDETLTAFAESLFSKSYKESLTSEEILSLLREIRQAAYNFGGVGLEVREEGLVAMFFEVMDKKVLVEFMLDSQSGKISQLELVSVLQVESIDPITWGNYEIRLQEEKTAGFSGAVLIARNDTIILEQGYGFADRENNIPVKANTIFAIGSTPIDFTNAAILKLEEMGKLNLDDQIGRWLTDVPEDKRKITIQYLRSGRSGLPDFHDTEEDEDPDLSWIDRSVAINRILGQPLLFQPGEGNRHSHSAWVLLAAIVEIVSDQPYEEFLKDNFFSKIGMTRTGSYTFSRSFPASEVAIGYGSSKPTEPNSPQHWGETSWLVKGSGGMVSTVGDLWRWYVAMKKGKLLGSEAMKKYPLYSAGVGGNMRGFLNCFDFEPTAAYILCSNSHESMDDQAFRLSQALERMVVGE
jgi:hypothetical protein